MVFSFILQEAHIHCVERGSPLHVCYLDATIDCVWISGLLYKLQDKGITGKDLRIINSTLMNASNYVVHD